MMKCKTLADFAPWRIFRERECSPREAVEGRKKHGGKDIIRQIFPPSLDPCGALLGLITLYISLTYISLKGNFIVGAWKKRRYISPPHIYFRKTWTLSLSSRKERRLSQDPFFRQNREEGGRHGKKAVAGGRKGG